MRDGRRKKESEESLLLLRLILESEGMEVLKGTDLYNTIYFHFAFLGYGWCG